MNKYKKYFFILIFIVLLFGLAYWWVHAGTERRKLIEALIAAVPIVLITLFFSFLSEENAIQMRKIEKQNLFLRLEEKYLQELEAWAEEMVIITGNPEGRWFERTSMPKLDGNPEVVTVERRQPSDLEINQAHAMAGIKQAFCRHMVTRHGRDYDNSPFHTRSPETAKRLAKAVIKYATLYEALLEVGEILQKNSDNEGTYLFEYEKFFVGMLYKVLTAEAFDNCLTKGLSETEKEQRIIKKLGYTP